MDRWGEIRVAKLPEGIRNLNAKIPEELHKRVRDVVYNRKITIDQYVCEVLDASFRGALHRAVGYTGTVNQQFNPADLPEQFLRDAMVIYSTSLDEFAALQRVTAAAARGQESISGSSVDRARFGALQPLPVERKPDDDKDKPG